MEGCIFSVEEFSTFDGPGIRTTVFMKGCPLRCQWCHNPEGQSFQPQYMRSPNGCLNCGACLEAGNRVTGAPKLVEESISVCPRHLVRRCGEYLTPQALFTQLEGRLWMLNATGGGITFSGGEPLSQPVFLKACLQLLAGKAHRAIQTSGFADPEIFRDILAHCDYVLFDLKHMDPVVHKHFTGADNRTILENYRTLVASGQPFITRIPLIPGVNDTEENLTATACFLRQLGVDRVELLPYNTGAGAKYKAAGAQYRVDFDTAQKPETRIHIFNVNNIEVTVL